MRTRVRRGYFAPDGRADSVPPIPIGITFAPVRAAKKAAPKAAHALILEAAANKVL